MKGRLLLGAVAIIVLATPWASAHQTQISDGVGGTHHIEPNDTPRAGEPSQTWFALTQAGGMAIGLTDCDCELVVVDAAGEAIATPELTAIDVEGLTDVPAAEVMFPRVGAYVLTLTGSPREEADFATFRLDFPITVAAGKASVELAGPKAALSDDPSNDVVGESPRRDGEMDREIETGNTTGLPLLPIGVFVGLATVLILAWQARRR